MSKDAFSHVAAQYTTRTWNMDSIAIMKTSLSNILKILPPKNENFQIKIRIFFFIFLLKTYIVGTR